jgi:hypothetical protein
VDSGGSLSRDRESLRTLGSIKQSVRTGWPQLYPVSPQPWSSVRTISTFGGVALNAEAAAAAAASRESDGERERRAIIAAQAGAGGRAKGGRSIREGASDDHDS